MPSAAESHGPVLMGTFLNVLLYGVSVMQTYLYWNVYKRKDPLYLRLLVLFLFLADTAHTAFTMAYMYIALIVHYDDPPYLQHTTWVFATEPALVGIIGGSVQLFFSWRVRMLTGNVFLAGIIAACALTACLSGIGTAISCMMISVFSELHRSLPVVGVWFGSASLVDILVAGSLVNYLRRHRTGIRSTDTQVDRIIRLTVQTDVITSLWGIRIGYLMHMLLYLLEHKGWHLMFNFSLAKIYTNSLMSSLNSRQGWHWQMDNVSPSQTAGQNVKFHSLRQLGILDLSTFHATSAEVQVEASEVESSETVDVNGEAKCAPLGKSHRPSLDVSQDILGNPREVV
ncbi:hypothetical protein GGG16DRAFT_114233 [Schizophyllum commune]